MATIFLLLLLLLLPPSLIHSQQSYEENAQLNCYDTTANNNTLGYTCNSLPTCPSFLTFRAQNPYRTPAKISSLFNSNLTSLSLLNNLPNSPNSPIPLDTLLLIPAPCSCLNHNLYQHNTTFIITPQSNTYQIVANDTFQGMSTCQSLIAQNKYDSRSLTYGMNITVPLRCACPTSRQSRNGVKYLVTYVVTWGDDLDSIAQRFQVDVQTLLDANGFGTSNDVIYPFTTVLIPVKTVPDTSGLQPPAPAPQANNVPAVGGNGGGGGGSGKKWVVFVGVGIGVGVVLLGLVLGWFCWVRRRRAGKVVETMPVTEGKGVGEVPSSSSYDDYGAALSRKGVSDSLVSSEVRAFIESLMVYKYVELEKATGYFSEENRIKGSVYRAVINGDAAAVKRLKGDVSNEIHILKQINHSNVVRLSGFCLHEGNTYLVYEFVEKGSLADWLHDNKEVSDCVLSWKQRIRIAYDIAEGLNYLHNYTNPPYIHKDLKSSNILLDSEFRAKLANFGLARPIEEEEEGPQLTRHVVGTQGYMAPEYLEHGLITSKLDVFAFGVVILELLSGKEATFSKDGGEKGVVLLWQLIDKVMSGEDAKIKLKGFIDPSLMNEYPFDLAFAIAELAMRCVAREPGSRPAVEEVLMSLSAIYNSTLDWDPSDVRKSGSFVQAR